MGYERYLLIYLNFALFLNKNIVLMVNCAALQ